MLILYAVRIAFGLGIFIHTIVSVAYILDGEDFVKSLRKRSLNWYASFWIVPFVWHCLGCIALAWYGDWFFKSIGIFILATYAVRLFAFDHEPNYRSGKWIKYLWLPFIQLLVNAFVLANLI